MTDSTLNPLEPGEAKAFSEALEKLQRLLHASDLMVSRASDPPVPTSRMARANADDLRESFDGARLLMYSAADHLRAVQMLMLGGKLPTFALYSLLRPAATCLVRARHLLDPGISERERLARGLNERLDNLEEQQKVPLPGVAEHVATRREKLVARATKNGVDIHYQKGRTDPAGVAAFGEHRESDLALCRLYLGEGELLFRYLSGQIHAMQWVQVSAKRARPTIDARVADVPFELDVVNFANILTLILALFDDTVGYWLTLAGYPADVWAEAKKGAP